MGSCGKTWILENFLPIPIHAHLDGKHLSGYSIKGQAVGHVLMEWSPIVSVDS